MLNDEITKMEDQFIQSWFYNTMRKKIKGIKEQDRKSI